MISSRSNPKNALKWKPASGNFKKHAENLLKMEEFHNLKCGAYQYAKLNTSEGVLRSREYSLETPEENKTALQKQEVKEYKRVTIRRNDETIQTYIYIQTFEKPSIPKEIKIGYMVENVEYYTPALLRRFKRKKC